MTTPIRRWTVDAGMRFDADLQAAVAHVARSAAVVPVHETYAPAGGGRSERVASVAMRLDHDPSVSFEIAILDDEGIPTAHPLFAGLDAFGLRVAWEGPVADPAIRTVVDAWAGFSAVELERVRSLASFGAGRSTPARGSVIVLRDHPLIEKIGLVTALQELAPVVCFVPKCDRTKYRHRTLRTMRDLGVLVVDGEDDVVDEVEFLCRSADFPVVIDDGGVLIAGLAARQSMSTMVAIETTTRGGRVLGDAQLLHRVTDLSRSSTKLALSRAVAASCVREFLGQCVHEPIGGAAAHVVGFGSIGGEVALILRQLGLSVSVSDPRSVRRAVAERLGFVAFEDAGAALRSGAHRYLVGCSGHRSISYRVLSQLVDGGVAWSVSSHDLAGAIEEAAEIGAVEPKGRGPGLAITATTGHAVRILAAGHAINLHHAEGVPEPDFHCFELEILDEVRRRLAGARAAPWSADSDFAGDRRPVMHADHGDLAG